MMKRFINLFAALLLVMGTSVNSYAADSVRPRPYHSFCPDGPSKEELVRRMENAVKANSDGTRRLEKCWATPNNFLEAFQKNDPDAKLTSITQLVPFIRDQLVLATPEPGIKYWSACIRKDWTVLAQCESRAPNVGEKVYMNKVTKKIDLQGDCANPVSVPDIPAPECIEQDVYLKSGDEHHIGLLGPDKLPASNCLAIMKAGETEWTSVVLDECPRCSFAGPAEALKMSEQRFTASTLVISYKAEKAGWYRLRLPVAMLKSDNYLVNCVIRTDGTQSRGMIIAKRHYRKGVAYIGYAGENVPADGGFMHTWLWDSVRIQMH